MELHRGCEHAEPLGNMVPCPRCAEKKKAEDAKKLEMKQCPCREIRHNKHRLEDGTWEEHWICAVCGARFVRASVHKILERDHSELQKNYNHLRLLFDKKMQPVPLDKKTPSGPSDKLDLIEEERNFLEACYDHITAARDEATTPKDMNLLQKKRSATYDALRVKRERMERLKNCPSTEIVDALFKDVRDRKWLGHVFSNHPTTICMAGCKSLDREVQYEIQERWKEIIEDAWSKHEGKP